ncbi:MAG: hypothetical protein CMN77_19835 [Spirochaetaceae bacterium]|nr:hypothetical protein [Spirochaetaceae bacterium]
MASSFRKEELTYCSNVHPGESARDIMNNLCHYVAVLRRNRELSNMATGIWISNQAARELANADLRSEFKDLLKKENLWPTSINGFPFGGFHEENVKEKVYSPDWSDIRRLDYTRQLGDLAVDLLREAPSHFRRCAISTVPLGFKSLWNPGKDGAAIENLLAAEAHFKTLSRESGIHISLCLEMEPGCVLESTSEVLYFWDRLYPPKLNGPDSKIGTSSGQDAKASQVQGHVSHLGLCYDICHQAVMFENIQESLGMLFRAGIPIFKFQISSAIEVRWLTDDGIRESKKSDIIRRLEPFCDKRYLHQTTISKVDLTYYLDLDRALESMRKDMEPSNSLNPEATGPEKLERQNAEFRPANEAKPGEWEVNPGQTPGENPEIWRIHYHVPIHLESLEDGRQPGAGLYTTAAQIEEALDFLASIPPSEDHRPVLEVETYTWTVLPESVRQRYSNVVQSIQMELDYLEKALMDRKLLKV